MKKNLIFLIVSISALLFIAPIASAQEENVEKETEKRIKIVKVDENGKKVVIDTILTGDVDLEELDLGEGMKWIKKGDSDSKQWKSKDGNIIIMSGDSKDTFSIYSKDGDELIGDEDVVVMKKGDGNVFTISKVEKKDGKNVEHITIHIDDDMVHTKDENVFIHSANSKEGAYFITVDDKDGKYITYDVKGGKNLSWIHGDDEELKDGEIHIVIKSNDEVQDMIINGDAVITIKDGKVDLKGETIKVDVKKRGDVKVVKEKKVEKELKKEKKK